MLYRETGQFKTSYAADMAIFPIRQDRIAMALEERESALLAAHGASVVVNDLGVSVAGQKETQSPADDVVKEIKAAGGKAIANHMDISTVEGGEEVELPADTQSGHEIRLRGKGVPRLRGAGRGDLHAIITVVVPNKLSGRERELLRELDSVSGPAVLPKEGPTIVDRLRDFFD